MRQTTVNIDNREFVIDHMNAQKALGVLKTILSSLFLEDVIGMMGVTGGTSSSKKDKDVLNEIEDMEKLQITLLSTVSELLKSGPVQVVDVKGNYYIEDVQYDMLLSSKLLLEVLKANYSSFFTQALELAQSKGIIPVMTEEELSNMPNLLKDFLKN